MALFTDGPISSLDELAAYDSQLLGVASVEGIDVTQKMRLAQEEIGLDLTTLLARLTYVDQLFWLPPQPNLGNVVVTPVLALWHAYRTLEMIYTDAYNSQLNDRYAGKRDQFHNLRKQAYERLIETGVGMTGRPIPQASSPSVVAAPGDLPDGTYYITMAWLNSASEEGSCATPAVATTSGSTLLVKPGAAPAIATGWNVYAGSGPDTMTLQNGSPVGVGDTWLQPGALITSGRGPGTGQSPTYVKPVPRVILRG